MIYEVALLIISCVLFVEMGLSQAIQNIIKVNLIILSCPKCLTFWSILLYCILNSYGFIICLATSFISSYIALWLVLLYDFLAIIYNRSYEKINKENSQS